MGISFIPNGYIMFPPSGAFSPDDVSGLVAWYDADFNSGFNSGSITDSSNVTDWADRTSTAGTMSNTTATQQPIYYTNILNGKPGVLFDNVDDWLSLSSSYSISDGFTVFIVVNQADTTTNRFFIGTTTSAYVGSNQFSSRLVANQGTNAIASGTNGTGGLLAQFTLNGSSSIIYTKNSEVTGLNTGTSGWNLNSLARQFNRADCYIHEVLIYTSVITGTDQTNIRQYTRDKWGSGI